MNAWTPGIALLALATALPAAAQLTTGERWLTVRFQRSWPDQGQTNDLIELINREFDADFDKWDDEIVGHLGVSAVWRTARHLRVGVDIDYYRGSLENSTQVPIAGGGTATLELDHKYTTARARPPAGRRRADGPSQQRLRRPSRRAESLRRQHHQLWRRCRYLLVRRRAPAGFPPPRGHLSPGDAAHHGRHFATVTTPGGQAVKLAIKIGIRGEDKTEILSGANEGDTLATKIVLPVTTDPQGQQKGALK